MVRLFTTVLVALNSMLMSVVTASKASMESALVLELELAGNIWSGYPANNFIPEPFSLKKNKPAVAIIDTHSLTENVSSHINVRFFFPVEHLGESFLHPVFGLTNDEIAMILGRDSRGEALKLADIYDATFGTTFVRVATSRRGVRIFEFEGSVGEEMTEPALVSKVERMLSRSLNVFGTQSSRHDFFLTKNALNTVFLNVSDHVKVKQLYKVQSSKFECPDLPHSQYDPICGVLTNVVKNAYLVRTETDPSAMTAKLAGSYSSRNDKYFSGTFMLKYGGNSAGTGPSGLGSNFPLKQGHYIWLTIGIDEDAVSSQLPSGVVLASSEAEVFVAYYPYAYLYASHLRIRNENFPHHRFGVRVKVYLPDSPTVLRQHIIYMLTDDDVQLMFGRDFLGTPSKLGSFDFPLPDEETKISNGPVSFTVKRNDDIVFAFEGKMDGPGETSAPGISDNVKDFSVFSTQFPFYYTDSAPEGQPLYIEWSGDHDVTESYKIDKPSVKFGKNAEPWEPIAKWFVGEPTAAGFQIMNGGNDNQIVKRNVVGSLPLQDAVPYWERTYMSKYGGKPHNNDIE